MKDSNEQGSIDKKIEAYEHLMHKVLRNYNVTYDYDDLLQELRISLWKILTNEDPETMFIEESDAKFTTYLYTVFSNRVIDIMRCELKVRVVKEEGEVIVERKKPKIKEIIIRDGKEIKIMEEEVDAPNPVLSADEIQKREIARPTPLSDLSFTQENEALLDVSQSDMIRSNTDLETFELTLNEVDSQIWKLSLESWNQSEIARILKDKGYKRKTQSTVSRRLNELRNKYKRFLREGEL